MNQNCKIDVTDTIQSAIFKVSEGNPGALNVVLQMIQSNEEIDPDCAFGPYGPLLSLDSYAIYGDGIWILFKDICGQSIPKTLGVLRGMQLGIIGEATVHEAINGRRQGKGASTLNVDAVMEKVCKRLPKFNKGASKAVESAE